MSTWSTITKYVSSYINQAKSDVITYLTASDETIYLVGATEEDYLITQGVTTWTNVTKN